MAVSSTIGRRIGKIIAWLLAIIVILIVALAIFIMTFDWNRARPYINDKVTQAIGRPFAINGDLKVGWRHPVGETGWRGWVPWPRFSAANITVGNPDWTKQPQIPSAVFDGALTPTARAFEAYTGNLALFTSFIQEPLQTYWNSLTPAQLAQLDTRGYKSFDLMWNDVNGFDPDPNVQFEIMRQQNWRHSTNC